LFEDKKDFKNFLDKLMDNFDYLFEDEEDFKDFKSEFYKKYGVPAT